MVGGERALISCAHSRSLPQAGSPLPIFSQFARAALETKVGAVVSKKCDATQWSVWPSLAKDDSSNFLTVLLIQHLKVRNDCHYYSKRFSLTPCKTRLRLAATHVFMFGVRLTPESLTSTESEKVPAMQITQFLNVRTPLMAVEGFWILLLREDWTLRTKGD